MKILLTFSFIFSISVLVNSKCCGGIAMYWSTRNSPGQCSPYSEFKYLGSGDPPYGATVLGYQLAPRLRCIAKVCGDGKVHGGFYCGKGKCNIFGCNCDGGCIEGNAEENFRRESGIGHASGGIDVFDPTTWHN